VFQVRTEALSEGTLYYYGLGFLSADKRLKAKRKQIKIITQKAHITISCRHIPITISHLTLTLFTPKHHLVICIFVAYLSHFPLLLFPPFFSSFGMQME